MPSVPRSGTYQSSDFVPNSAPAILGPEGAQYIIDGWKCIVGGTPGTWVECHYPVATPPAAPAPTSSPAPAPTPSTQKEQVEDGAFTGGLTTSTAIAGYEGTGHSDWMTVDGEAVTVTFTDVLAGTYTLNIRYYCFTVQNNFYSVNGGPNINFYQGTTGAWTVLAIPNVTLVSGTNTIRLSKNDGYAYFDYVEIVPGSTSPPAPAPAPAPAPGSAPYYPFGARTDLTGGTSYPHGILPNNYTASQMDTRVKACYDAWKAARLTAAPAFYADSGIYAGQTISDGYYVSWSNTTYGTVSEGIGYGMLITVLMAGYEANAQTYFNGLYKVARGRPAYAMPSTSDANKYLSEWRLYTDMSSAGGGYNALDGDLDIALALLMAHRQWGSSGAINYYQQALNTIAAMKAANFASTGEPWYSWQRVSRTSDYMIGHFRAFKAATNDTFWDTAISRCQTLITNVISGYSATPKLTPGFIAYTDTASPVPSPGGLIESPWEGDFDGNAIRNPWRWGADYIYSGDATWGTFAKNIVSYIQTECGSDPWNTAGQYRLDGTGYAGRYFAPGTVGCELVGAMCDSGLQSWLNTLFTANTDNFRTAYYDSELQLLPLIVASGNWWRP
jgi:hypothetical protein